MLGKTWFRWGALISLIILGGLIYKSEVLVPVHIEFHDDTIPIFDESRGTNQFGDYLENMYQTLEKQNEIQKAIQSSWMAYSNNAFGSDYYMPISKQNKTLTGIGWTMLDALDTLMMMGMDDEVAKVRKHIAGLDFKEMDVVVNIYEAMSRGVGGLLGAYHLSKDSFYAYKAAQLAERLLPAIETHSGIPALQVNLATASISGPDEVPLAEVGSLGLELLSLGNVTNNPKWARAAKLFTQTVERIAPKGGLLPDRINWKSAKFVGKNVVFGMGQASYIENLVRQDILTTYSDASSHNMVGEILDSVSNELVEVTHPSRYRFLGSMPQGVQSNRREFVMDQDACSIGGVLAVHGTRAEWYYRATMLGMTEVDKERYRLGQHITRSCAATWLQSKTKIGPYRFTFNLNPRGGQDFRAIDPRYLQTSGVFESLYFSYRLTKDPLYREWGWNIFEALRKNTMLEDGSFMCLKDVGRLSKTDYMNPSWLGSSLKYMWMLFTHIDQIFPLESYPSSRGHFFPIFQLPPSLAWKREHFVTLQNQR